MTVQIAHTSALDPETLTAAHALLEVVFAGELTDDDWEHCLGGLHALAYEGDELIGHAAVVQRRLLYDGKALRAGYVEGVAVRADAQRRGHASAMMGVLEDVIGRAYDVGALGSSDEGLPFYTGRGWQPWRGTLSMLTPSGVIATPDEVGWILVFGGDLDLDRELTVADWRDGDVW